MTEVERFLAKQQRYRCERLSAWLTEEQCRVNQERPANFANDLWDCGPCKGCAGLNKDVPAGKEVRVSKGVCKIDGCEKYQVKHGMCWLHAKEKGFDPSPKVKSGAVSAAPAVTPAEVAGSDMSSEIRALFELRCQEWLQDLAGATTVRSRAKMFLAMVERLEGLGY